MSGLELVWGGRLAYTQIKRHSGKDREFPIAHNARQLAPDTAEILAAQTQHLQILGDGQGVMVKREAELVTTNHKGDSITTEKDVMMEDEKGTFVRGTAIEVIPSSESDSSLNMITATGSATTRDSAASISSTDTEDYEVTKTVSHVKPIAVLPQYVTPHPTTLQIKETGLPHGSSSFKVLASDDTELFFVHRERPSWRGRQVITDCRDPDTPLLTIRKLANQRPTSYWFADSLDTDILEIHGKFYIPYKGAKSVATFTNAVDRTKVKLSMQGSYRNKHAMVKNEETGEVLVTMSSEVLNAKALLGRRRDYSVDIAGGVDIILAIAMIVALDARAD